MRINTVNKGMEGRWREEGGLRGIGNWDLKGDQRILINIGYSINKISYSILKSRSAINLLLLIPFEYCHESNI